MRDLIAIAKFLFILIAEYLIAVVDNVITVPAIISILPGCICPPSSVEISSSNPEILTIFEIQYCGRRHLEIL